MSNLTIIVRAYRVVTLADMDGNMNILGQIFNRYIDCFDRDPHSSSLGGVSYGLLSGYACSLLGQVF